MKVHLFLSYLYLSQAWLLVIILKNCWIEDWAKMDKILAVFLILLILTIFAVGLSSASDCPVKCEVLFDPVCGSNRQTYKTTCHLKRYNCFEKLREKVIVVHKGECLAKENDETEPHKSYKCMRVGRGKYLNCWSSWDNNSHKLIKHSTDTCSLYLVIVKLLNVTLFLTLLRFCILFSRLRTKKKKRLCHFQKNTWSRL